MRQQQCTYRHSNILFRRHNSLRTLASELGLRPASIWDHQLHDNSRLHLSKQRCELLYNALIIADVPLRVDPQQPLEHCSSDPAFSFMVSIPQLAAGTISVFASSLLQHGDIAEGPTFVVGVRRELRQIVRAAAEGLKNRCLTKSSDIELSSGCGESAKERARQGEARCPPALPTHAH